MAHIGRTIKNLEAPRPLKSQSRASLKNNYLLIEDVIQLIEHVALTLQSDIISNAEPMASLVQNLRIHGPQLEAISKDTLDRAFVVFRNASQDERLNIMTRLNLLELIELRAKGWEDTGFNSYYKSKHATNIEMPEPNQQHHTTDIVQAVFLSTSPTFGAGSTAAIGSAQQALLLGPGELIRNSGKFAKPTKIPGKTYCKDEIVIRNTDSGKVNPGARERLVQITGPSEDKINYAKHLIEDTIRRNASPVRLDPAAGMGGVAHTVSSSSSLASSNSDENTSRSGGGAGCRLVGGGGGGIANRLSLNSAQNFMTDSAAAQQAAAIQQQAAVAALLANSTPITAAVAADEYKYTVNVGQHVIKITGDCCDLVRVAKLVLDDYFCSAEFLVSVEAGAAFDNSVVSPTSAPSTPMGGQPPPFMLAAPLADSGIGLNYMGGRIANNATDVDDDVFIDANGIASTQNNGVARSRRSHFSRKDSTPEAATPSCNMTDYSSVSGRTKRDTAHITYDYDHLLCYSKSPHAWSLPLEWQKICERFPAIVRNKVTTHASSTNATYITRLGASAATKTSHNSNHNNICNGDESIVTSTPKSDLVHDYVYAMQLNVRNKGYFNHPTYNIDDDRRAIVSSLKQQQQQKFKPAHNASTSQQQLINKMTTLPSPSTPVLDTNHNHNHNNNIRSRSRTPTSPFRELNSNNLLNKQIKLITSITEKSGTKFEAPQLSQEEPIIISDSEDDEIDYNHSNIERHERSYTRDSIEQKFQRQYRSNSTSD